jgi:hypothetical protein
VLRSFLARASYLIFLAAALPAHFRLNSTSLPDRALPVALLTVPAYFATRFIRRLSPQLRNHLQGLVTSPLRLRSHSRVPRRHSSRGQLDRPLRSPTLPSPTRRRHRTHGTAPARTRSPRPHTTSVEQTAHTVDQQLTSLGTSSRSTGRGIHSLPRRTNLRLRHHLPRNRRHLPSHNSHHPSHDQAASSQRATHLVAMTAPRCQQSKRRRLVRHGDRFASGDAGRTQTTNEPRECGQLGSRERP